MNYDYKIFENLEDLKETYPELSKELLNMFEEGNWIYEKLIVYPTLKDYTKYELTDGWYSNSFKDDYNRAHNPLDYIDLNALGDALSRSWDETIYYLSDDDKVVYTAIVW